jgi:integrase
VPQLVIDTLAAHLAAYSPRDGFVFGGLPLGLRVRRVGTGFHQLRHFYASLLIMHGESVRVVKARLGHASPSETLDTYSHLWRDSFDRTRAAVEAVITADSVRTKEGGRLT